MPLWTKYDLKLDKTIKLRCLYDSSLCSLQLAIKMDALEQYLKIEKMDAAAITEAAIKHKEQKWTDVSHNYKDVENQGKDFIKKAADVRTQIKIKIQNKFIVQCTK